MSQERSPERRVDVILDSEHAFKLQQLAERTRTDERALASSLLSTALDDADPNPRDITALLDGIGHAFERALVGRGQTQAGLGVPLEEL